MHLDLFDWIIIALYLLLALFIGLRFRNQAGKSLSDFFLGGRSLPWYLAGISMVATTFAADTPLWVTEVIAQKGISGNWLWWNMLIGGMLTTFFFSKLWRRANILTELELIELRYSGAPARFLRGFKSVYMGIFLNCVIIGWVNVALMTILKVFFDIPVHYSLLTVAIAMVIVAFYSALSGLKGVVITDTMQFVIAMVGCIILAVVLLATPEVGGMSGLKAQLPAWRFSFFPQVGGPQGVADQVGVFSLSIGAFLTFGLVQWWASWYPGAEPGGGGYVAQRMMSTKSEKDAVYATLFFQIAHYCLRPWPWIIVGLCALVLYPQLPVSDAGQGFVLAMRDHLPTGLKGLLLVAFLSAYMSTISTQLNWGSSFLTNDLYKRFIRPPESFENEAVAEKDYVAKGRWFTIIIMLVALLATSMMTTIDAAAKFLIACGAGLGLVLILRWYWWRINAWSEIAASVAPVAGYLLAHYVLNLGDPYNFLFIVGFSTVCWVIVTFVSPATETQTLQNFYHRVRPQGIWGAYAEGESSGGESGHLGYLFGSWISAIVMTYSILFAMGKLIFAEWTPFLCYSIVSVVSLALLRYFLNKSDFFK